MQATERFKPFLRANDERWWSILLIVTLTSCDKHTHTYTQRISNHASLQPPTKQNTFSTNDKRGVAEIVAAAQLTHHFFHQLQSYEYYRKTCFYLSNRFYSSLCHFLVMSVSVTWAWSFFNLLTSSACDIFVQGVMFFVFFFKGRRDSDLVLVMLMGKWGFVLCVLCVFHYVLIPSRFCWNHHDRCYVWHSFVFCFHA